jgi:Holliday junction resolvase RusA-like endonuclease
VFVSDKAFREGFARQGLRTANADEAFPIAWTAMRSLTPAATRETEKMLRQALAVEMRRAGLAPFARPLAVSFDFVLEGDSSLAPVGKRDGDLDNLEKLALDAMNGVVFEDDRLVVMKWSRKRFGDEPSVVILAVEISESLANSTMFTFGP